MVEPIERTLRVTIVVPAYNEAERLDPGAFLQFAAERGGAGLPSSVAAKATWSDP